MIALTADRPPRAARPRHGPARPGLLSAGSSTSKRSKKSALRTPPSSPAGNLHAALEADEDGETVNLELSQFHPGPVGKVDCLRRRDGSHIPYEHKRGQPRAARWPARPTAWPSDRLQLIAYAVLLEEAFGASHGRGPHSLSRRQA